MSEEQNDSQIEYLTRDEAVQLARAQVKRDLTETESTIAYVAFIPGIEDFCRCEFRMNSPHGWVQTARLLATNERHPDEQITDERIVKLARTGNMISAIRLYRAKHAAGLLEAKTSVERLVEQSFSTLVRDPSAI